MHMNKGKIDETRGLHMTEEESSPMTALEGLHAHGTRIRHVTDEGTGSESILAIEDSIESDGHQNKFMQERLLLSTRPATLRDFAQSARWKACSTHTLDSTSSASALWQ